MELSGDEKRIQALFSELSFENQSLAPQFGHLWTRAQQQSSLRRAVAPPREKNFFRPVAVIVSLLVTGAAGSLGVWAWYSFTPSPNIANYSAQPVPVDVGYAPTPVRLVREKVKLRHPKHIARQRQVDRNITAEAALLSSWQSPTQQFMESPTSLALGSLPQLNQSVKDLESFLSKKDEIMKESNQ